MLPAINADCCSYFNDVYRRFCFGDAAFNGRLNPKQFELAFQASARVMLHRFNDSKA